MIAHSATQGEAEPVNGPARHALPYYSNALSLPLWPQAAHAVRLFGVYS
jgi:hypothetical protein